MQWLWIPYFPMKKPWIPSPFGQLPRWVLLILIHATWLSYTQVRLWDPMIEAIMGMEVQVLMEQLIKSKAKLEMESVQVYLPLNSYRCDSRCLSSKSPQSKTNLSLLISISLRQASLSTFASSLKIAKLQPANRFREELWLADADAGN